MARIIFWGKPGCVGNARQIALLHASGHDVDVRDLRVEPWTPERLRLFFGKSPIAAWFNRGAARVKRGELRPELLSEMGALEEMIADPYLIRRPLMECDGRVAAGFDPPEIAAWIGLAEGLPAVGEGCPRQDLPPCSP